MNGQAFAPNLPGAYRIPNMPKDWFTYPLLFSTVTPASNATQTFQIDASSDFFLTALTFQCAENLTTSVTVTTMVLPMVTIQITDGGSNRNLFQSQVPLWGVVGDGNHPHKLMHPRLYVRNSAVSVTMTSYASGITYSRIYINFEGFRIYQ